MGKQNESKRIHFTIVGYIDISTGADFPETIESLKEVGEKISEFGAVELFRVSFPAIEIDISA